MKKKILFIAVATALALAFVLPSFGVMNVQCQDDNDCPVGMTCVEHVCVMTGDSETTWSCDGSSKVKCSAHCGKCGTSVSGTGALRGSHSCS